MKIELIVIDSFGIGEMPDADKFGDKGSDTYLNTYKKTGGVSGRTTWRRPCGFIWRAMCQMSEERGS